MRFSNVNACIRRLVKRPYPLETQQVVVNVKIHQYSWCHSLFVITLCCNFERMGDQPSLSVVYYISFDYYIKYINLYKK